MFLNYLKSFLLKKNLKRQLKNVNEESLNCPIMRVGLIVDESNFLETSALKQVIIDNGILENNIKIIVFHDDLNGKGIHSQISFGLKDLNLKCEFIPNEINSFISDDFDLLINYYSEEKPFLLLLTNKTNAKFKVGFSTIDKRLNHLLINIAREDYKGFTHELFRYLKILNKI